MTKVRHDTIQFTAVAGTVQTISYPLSKSADDYLGGTDHFLVTNSTRTLRSMANDFTVVFGASNITLTSMLGLAANQVCYLNLDRAGEDVDEDVTSRLRLAIQQVARVTLGAVEAAVSAGVCASQALLSANNGVLNGSLLAGGVISFATPRNVVAAWTGTAVLTVTGTDEFGAVVVESSASGITFTGKKAFKTITKVRVSADVTGLTVGTGNVLGLPVYLADVADAFRESVDGVVPAAGTFVAADRTSPPTATTGDVRGTWAPNAAPNAARFYEAALLVRSVSYKGGAQFAG